MRTGFITCEPIDELFVHVEVPIHMAVFTVKLLGRHQDMLDESVTLGDAAWIIVDIQVRQSWTSEVSLMKSGRDGIRRSWKRRIGAYERGGIRRGWKSRRGV